MCGIAGAFRFKGEASPINRSALLRISELLKRRGPDGEGFWSSKDDRVALAHRRLAIIDTGPSGAQPMGDKTERWTITFNGEIYNYQELRAELQSLGRVFRTNSDTEVLINAIAEWGEAGLVKLRGMYAFALWDNLKRELWLARDPFGIKPLYVAEAQGTIWFSSQARAMAQCAPVNIDRDAAAIVGFYLWGHVPEPFSWWEGIKSFPAGHVQRLQIGQTSFPPKPFARIQDAYLKRPIIKQQDDTLQQWLRASIRYHLVADVPIGMFLSAGIDSCVIAALAVEQGVKLNTITLAFNEYRGTSYNEAPLAEVMAKTLGTEHATVWINQDDFEGLLDDFFSCMDQPTIDGLNTYLVSHAASKQGIKVALSGLGGDELFGGYPSFRRVGEIATWGRRCSHIPGLQRMLEATSTIFSHSGIQHKAMKLPTYWGSLASAYFLIRALNLEDALDEILDESWVMEGLQKLQTQLALSLSIAGIEESGGTEHAQISALESSWYMRNQLLRDTDWSSMAHGVEVRLPFVDWPLLQQIGPSFNIRTPPSKIDLANCTTKLVEDIRSRNKTGFSTPVKDWIDAGSGVGGNGLKKWAAVVHRNFRTALTTDSAIAPLAVH
ncbi:MAG: asparagine synthase (glutamine-hydrolyzing) [Rhizobiales bacterium]|nr:asparagine synthase (glutamine-hydrolyzing) [Hyphomicrobiales bacterium]